MVFIQFLYNHNQRVAIYSTHIVIQEYIFQIRK